ncbi:MAG: GNAT family N-acetyltransferase [Candidatus Delongbacteria bacterium]|nr:GNAT family N-acetyltransferase [Candidatus Delongbacteria bacterium]MCG2760274.1 GNAT family N-acetyltransferase [Candidatus Delongbacteria bacterium]
MIELKISTPEEIKSVFESEWGANYIVTRGSIIKYTDVEGFTAKENNEILGLITYVIRGTKTEVTSLNSFRENEGIGTLLINKVIETAKQAGIERLWLITTNDNTKALEFYKKRNFRIIKVHEGAIAESRKLKPSIPFYGNDGIEIRDEVEMEYDFT